MFRVVAQHQKHGLLPVQPHDGVCVIGRSPDAHLRLEGWNVGKEHARLVQREDGVHAEAVGALGSIIVNGERVKWYGPLSDRDIIEVAGVTVRVEREASQSTLPSSPTSPTEEADAERVVVTAQPQSAPEPDLPRTMPVDPRWMQWRQGIEERLRTQMDLRRLDLSSMSREELQRMVTQLASEVVQGMRLPPELDRERLIKEVVDEAVGLGPLEDLLADETVTEIMVNRFDEVFIERSGRLQPAPTVFSSEQAVRHIIDRIVAPIGRRIDESSP